MSKIVVKKEHCGIAFILKDTYKPNMNALALLEATRGVWYNVPYKDERLKYAYATYEGVVKEVYKISVWVNAGTQTYVTRNVSGINNLTRRKEFIGTVAEDEVRVLYIDKVIDMPRSYGTPFIKVGV